MRLESVNMWQAPSRHELHSSCAWPQAARVSSSPRKTAYVTARRLISICQSQKLHCAGERCPSYPKQAPASAGPPTGMFLSSAASTQQAAPSNSQGLPMQLPACSWHAQSCCEKITSHEGASERNKFSDADNIHPKGRGAQLPLPLALAGLSFQHTSLALELLDSLPLLLGGQAQPPRLVLGQWALAACSAEGRSWEGTTQPVRQWAFTSWARHLLVRSLSLSGKAQGLSIGAAPADGMGLSYMFHTDVSCPLSSPSQSSGFACTEPLPANS